MSTVQDIPQDQAAWLVPPLVVSGMTGIKYIRVMPGGETTVFMQDGEERVGARLYPEFNLDNVPPEIFLGSLVLELTFQM